jgi:hypothetical protein
VSGEVADCASVAARLPWLVNGTLAADEERRVRHHLESCAACREELAATHRALALVSGHVPAESLVDFAFESDPSPERREEVALHVARCPACSADLRQVFGSRAVHDRDAAEDGGPAPSPAARRLRMAWASTLAASLVAASMAALWWRAELRARRGASEAAERALGSGGAGPSAAPDPAPRVEEQQLRSRLAQLESPRVNVPVFELEPRGAPLLRSGADGPAVNVVELGSEPAVTFILLAPPLPGAGPHALRLLDGTGTEVWRSEDLVARRGGDFAVALPVSRLPGEQFTLRVERRGAAALEYPVRARLRAPPPQDPSPKS